MGSLLFGSGSPLMGGPLGTYDQNAGNVLGQVAGLSGPLQQTLSGIANYQANNALNSTAQNFSNMGGLGSGAAAQAFGKAIASPFAQAQGSLQSGQLQAGSGALHHVGKQRKAYGTSLERRQTSWSTLQDLLLRPI